jgi:hypothetical protein
MKRTLVIGLILSTILLINFSCASIVSKSYYPLSINSTPSEANFTILNNKSQVFFTGKTPQVVELKASSGYFKKATYMIRFELDGYDSKIIPVTSTLDGWYFGNIVFGGLIGLLVVDPATGAMFKLNQLMINPLLTKTVADLGNEKNQLQIYSINDIPESLKGALVKIEE